MTVQAATTESCSGICNGAPREPGADSFDGEASIDVDGGARAEVGHLGPAHRAGSERADWRRSLLCAVALRPRALLLVIVCVVLNWLGDSLDGTLARVRQQQRPRYGFYVDHMVDILGSVALMGGLGCSGFLHWQAAIAMLIGFLLLSSESYLATYTLSRFQMSQGMFRADGDSYSADHRQPGAAA